MTNNIYVYLTDMPTSVAEAVVPCIDGYTIYLNSRLSREAQMEGYKHALGHIEGHDWERSDIQRIEKEAHKKCRH